MLNELKNSELCALKETLHRLYHEPKIHLVTKIEEPDGFADHVWFEILMHNEVLNVATRR